jgi:hypothetical protein
MRLHLNKNRKVHIRTLVTKDQPVPDHRVLSNDDEKIQRKYKVKRIALDTRIMAY